METAIETEGLAKAFEGAYDNGQGEELWFDAIAIDVLEDMSQGLDSQETGSRLGLSYGQVEHQRNIAKKLLGMQTRHQTIVELIQNRIIPVVVENDLPAVRLSPRQLTIARLLARGWKLQEIAQRCQISDTTVTTNYSEICGKTGSRNIRHSMRRLFELGVFKVEEEILDPDEMAETANNRLRVEVGGSNFGLVDLGIERPHEIEILESLARLDNSFFRRSTLYRLGFMLDNSSKNAKAHAFKRAISGVISKLELAYGEPVIEKVGSYGIVSYKIKQPLSIGPPDQMRVIPMYEEGSSIKEFETRQVQRARQPRPKPATPKIIPPAREKQADTSQVSVEIRSVYDDYLDSASLPELTPEFLSNLRGRDVQEVRNNQDVIDAVSRIARLELVTEYRPRVLIPLRYGVGPDFSRTAIAINRGDKYVKLQEIMEHVPAYQGLSVEDTSNITGLTPLAVLREEEKFLKTHAGRYPALEKLRPVVRGHIARLRQAV